MARARKAKAVSIIMGIVNTKASYSAPRSVRGHLQWRCSRCRRRTSTASQQPQRQSPGVGHRTRNPSRHAASTWSLPPFLHIGRH